MHVREINGKVDLMMDPPRRPLPDEYNEFYAGYVSCVPDRNLFSQLEQQIEVFRSTLSGEPEERFSVIHEPFTWTIKQVVGHLIDAEKLFGWRAHRFGCGDKTPLPGMDQNPYVDAINYEKVSIASLIDELDHTRQSNIAFLKRLEAASWDCVGTADGNPITVRALAYILVGHVNHHFAIIRKRLGLDD